MARPRKAITRFARALGVIAVASAASAPAAAANILTPRSSHSPGAGEMSHAYVIVAILATIAALAVNVALVLLVRRFRAARGREPLPPPVGGTRRIHQRLLGGLAAAAAILLILGIVLNDRAREVPASSGASASKPPLSIRVAGQQWLWRYTYPDGTFNYYELVVPAGRTVKLNLDSTDVIHRWWVPGLTAMAEAVPGRINHLSFRADRPGVYDGQSATFSGASYAAMRIRVRAVSEGAFTAWLAGQKRDLLTAQAAVQKALGEQGGAATAPSATLTPGVAPQTSGGAQ
ncbi:MAG: cytochrome c oxidase subunit [Solirubrobacterales bacterium]|nr:cytochrome c oxidase subunit [Solirubrobacterales bacterium]